VLRTRQLTAAHAQNSATPLKMHASPTMSNQRRTALSSVLRLTIHLRNNIRAMTSAQFTATAPVTTRAELVEARNTVFRCMRPWTGSGRGYAEQFQLVLQLYLIIGDKVKQQYAGFGL
jgi:hypothetical protein